ncbi:Uncharacterised protein [Mycobacteroides abscessus subsp. abscessus]|nr:Uncharacterised protein [Mycobacteroides abscessus subsp. abscessus]
MMSVRSATWPCLIMSRLAPCSDSKTSGKSLVSSAAPNFLVYSPGFQPTVTLAWV